MAAGNDFSSPSASAGSSLQFFREAATALLIHSVLLLKVAVLENACANTQFANQVEDIHICRDFQLGRLSPHR